MIDIYKYQIMQSYSQLCVFCSDFQPFLLGFTYDQYQVHSYQSRQANYYRIPYFRKNIAKLTIAYQGPNILELTSTKIKATVISSLKTF